MKVNCATPTSNCSTANKILAPPIHSIAQNVYHCSGFCRSRHRSFTLLCCCLILWCFSVSSWGLKTVKSLRAKYVSDS